MFGKVNNHEMGRHPIRRRRILLSVTLQPEKNAVGKVGYLQEAEDAEATVANQTFD